MKNKNPAHLANHLLQRRVERLPVVVRQRRGLPECGVALGEGARHGAVDLFFFSSFLFLKVLREKSEFVLLLLILILSLSSSSTSSLSVSFNLSHRVALGHRHRHRQRWRHRLRQRRGKLRPGLRPDGALVPLQRRRARVDAPGLWVRARRVEQDRLLDRRRERVRGVHRLLRLDASGLEPEEVGESDDCGARRGVGLEAVLVGLEAAWSV